MLTLLADLFFPLSCLCPNVLFSYVLQIPTLSSLRHIIVPTEPGQVRQQAMISFYTPISKHTAFDTDVLYGQFNVFIYL